MAKKEKIAVLGGGSWGATLASHLADLNHQISLWEFDPERAEQIKTSRKLDTIPDLFINKSVEVSHKIGPIVKGCDVIISATPSHAVRSTFAQKAALKNLKRGALVISVTKGIEQDTFLTMSQIIREIFTKAGDIVILSGPSHAEEVAKREPVALVAASTSPAASGRVQSLVKADHFRVYPSQDPIGVELGGSLKNIYAVVCGIVDGLSLGDNTKAAVMTRGLAEITRLGVKLDCAPLTFFGLAGLGDLIVTCNSPHSRNRQLGELIGKGKTLKEALAQMTMVAEGVNTTNAAFHLARKLGVETPIINEIYKVLFEKKSPKDSVRSLMARQVGPEMEGIVL